MAFLKILKKNFSHQFWFFLLLVFLPTQLGFHLWPNWSLVYGIRVDYLSPTIYLSDVLVLLVILTWLVGFPSKYRQLVGFAKKNKWLLLLTVVFVASNAFFAKNWQAAAFKWFKLAELGVFILYVFDRKLRDMRKFLTIGLSFALIYSCLLAVLQFIFQRTLGGVFYIFGERSFSSLTPGIALGRYFFDSSLMLRPYSTFPHPNVLAGFSLVSVILLLSLGETSGKAAKLMVKLAMAAGIVLIILSLSQSAWFAAVLLIFLGLILKKNPKFYFQATTLVFILSVVFSLSLPALATSFSEKLSIFEDPISTRLELAILARKMTEDYPLNGVGLNNFIVRLPDYETSVKIAWWLQPVHNIFLLVLAETGLIGLVVFLFLITKMMNNLRSTRNRLEFNLVSGLTAAIVAVVLTGVTDHYWFTLQQTQILLSLILGLSYKVKS